LRGIPGFGKACPVLPTPIVDTLPVAFLEIHRVALVVWPNMRATHTGSSC
jgi:hypothetical protein